MLAAAWKTFVELSPWLLLGAAVAGVLEACLPPGLLRRKLSGPGGVLRAVAVGAPLPLCSCGVIPAGLGLKKQGASDGATVGFLISTPQTGVDSVLVTAAMLGWPLALFKLATAAVAGLAGGWLADRLADPRPAYQPLPVLDEPFRRHRWRAGLKTADELVRSIWLWVLAGVVISAAITTYAPAGGLADLAAYRGLPAMLAALGLSLPLYVCATASVPIAESLIDAGLPTGSAIVFLMAGPATNVAALGAVYRVLGAKPLAVYLATILITSISAGLLFGWLIEPRAAASTHLHDHGDAWWATASAIALLLLFARYAAERLFHNETREDAPHA